MVFGRRNRSHEKAAESSKLKPYDEIHGFHEIHVFQVIRKLSSFSMGDCLCFPKFGVHWFSQIQVYTRWGHERLGKWPLFFPPPFETRNVLDQHLSTLWQFYFLGRLFLHKLIFSPEPHPICPTWLFWH